MLDMEVSSLSVTGGVVDPGMCGGVPCEVADRFRQGICLSISGKCLRIFEMAPIKNPDGFFYGASRVQDPGSYLPSDFPM